MYKEIVNRTCPNPRRGWSRPPMGTSTKQRPGAGPTALVRSSSFVGKVGAAAKILGTKLIGATTGTVQVVTPNGTLSSNGNVPFTVRP